MRPLALLGDLRHGFRSLRRSPAFAAAGVLTLALGIGAAVGIFSAVDAVLLRPLPFPDAERLIVVRQRSPDDAAARFETSYPDWRDWRDAAADVALLGAHSSSLLPMVMGVGDASTPVSVALATPELFTALGVGPLRGRALLPADERPGAEPVVVVAVGLWRRAFGAAPELVGRSLTLDGVSRRVVGVMPAELGYPHGAEAWVPVRSVVGEMAENRGVGFLLLVGRLAPGIGLGPAEAAMQEIVREVINPERAASGRAEADVTPLAEELVGPGRPVLRLLVVGSLLLLLLACANVASLLLARGVRRRDELAVRAALGGGPARLLGQVAGEGLAIGLTAAAVGTGVAWLVLEGVHALLPQELYRGAAIAIDGRAALVAATLGAAAAVLSSSLPALYGSRVSSGEALRGARGRVGAGRGTRRLLGGLVAAQVGLAVALLVTAGVLVRSLVALQAVELGFDRGRTLTLELYAPGGAFEESADVLALHEEMIRRVEGLPGVESAAAVLLRPLDGPDGYDYPFTIEGRDPATQPRQPLLNYEAVTPGYFRTMGIELLSGRDLTPEDGAGAPPVVVLSRAVADRFWPDGTAVGSRIKWGGPESGRPWITVVGVVENARYRQLEQASLDAYVPAAQAPWTLRHLVVRAAGDPAALAGPIRRVARAAAPGVDVVRVATVEDLVATRLRQPRLQALLVAVFAGMALALGLAGVYGVTAFTAAERTRELGLRSALGARRRDLERLLLGGTGVSVAAGTLMGLAAAGAASRLLAGLVYGVRPLDPATFLLVPVALAVTALAAAWLPARRAARTDPLATLRGE